MATEPIEIDELEPIPDPADGPSVFNSEVPEFFQAWSNINLQLQQNFDITYDNAQLAEAAAAAAAASEANSAATANNVGAWSEQTGAASPPLSVTHSGSVWILNEAIADITASEPGVSGDWTEAPGGGFTNPMDGTGQIIIGGTAGAPTKLPLAPMVTC